MALIISLGRRRPILNVARCNTDDELGKLEGNVGTLAVLWHGQLSAFEEGAWLD
jgi:hypothetical protein